MHYVKWIPIIVMAGALLAWDGLLGRASSTSTSDAKSLPTATPIKHLVVIFSENRSFDHYFGTYPQAANPAGEPVFDAAPGTPQVNGYLRQPSLLTANPNSTSAINLATGIPAGLMNPFRIDRAQFDTSGQNHAYTAEQLASHNERMDGFVAYTGQGNSGGAGAFGTRAMVMGYFDGNTVTALWNYAQRFAMSDNAFTDSFGPSTPGAINLVSGTTNGASNASGAQTVADGQGGWTMIGDPDPLGDVCSTIPQPVQMAGRNIGDLLNAARISWGGFMGGFDLSRVNANGSMDCKRSTASPSTSRTVPDYVPHHAWFQYFASTRNPAHTRPSAMALIGYDDPKLDVPGSATPVHHQYDLEDFFAALSASNFPAVSFLKAPAYQDGHPGNSNPLDEQAFFVRVINAVQQDPAWKDTAVIIAYDDSDGWYDHQSPTIVTSSLDPVADQFSGPGRCDGPHAKPAIGVKGKPVNGRCGPGSRVPFLVISPWARSNHVDSAPITQSSVLRFIEDNWLGGQRLGGGSNDAIASSILRLFDFKAPPRLKPLYLDPRTGQPVASPPRP